MAVRQPSSRTQRFVEAGHLPDDLEDTTALDNAIRYFFSPDEATQFKQKVSFLANRFHLDDVEDFLDDVLVALFFSLYNGKFCADYIRRNGSKATVLSFAFGIALNVARKNARSAAGGQCNDDLEQIVDPSQDLPTVVHGRLLSDALNNAIDDLPPIYRDAVRLSCYNGFSSEEAAQRCNVSPACMRKRLERALSLLAYRLKNSVLDT